MNNNKKILFIEYKNNKWILIIKLIYFVQKKKATLIIKWHIPYENKKY